MKAWESLFLLIQIIFVTYFPCSFSLFKGTKEKRLTFRRARAIAIRCFCPPLHKKHNINIACILCILFFLKYSANQNKWHVPVHEFIFCGKSDLNGENDYGTAVWQQDYFKHFNKVRVKSVQSSMCSSKKRCLDQCFSTSAALRCVDSQNAG